MQELDDTQSQADDRRIPIDRVGVKGLRFPVEITDRGGRIQHSVATVALTVDLPAAVRGTHMSRFVEALHSHGGRVDVRGAGELPQELLSRLGAEKARVTYDFTYFRPKSAPVSGKSGLMDYEVRFEIEADASGRTELQLTVIVPVATLCPCSKAISERGAHNQRGSVTFSVKPTGRAGIEDLVDLVEDSASCELFSILKRTDEKAVTERAYDHPVFVEDLVRNVVIRAEAHPAIGWYRVEAENFESIHNHSAYAMIEKGG